MAQRRISKRKKRNKIIDYEYCNDQELKQSCGNFLQAKSEFTMICQNRICKQWASIFLSRYTIIIFLML